MSRDGSARGVADRDSECALKRAATEARSQSREACSTRQGMEINRAARTRAISPPTLLSRVARGVVAPQRGGASGSHARPRAKSSPTPWRESREGSTRHEGWQIAAPARARARTVPSRYRESRGRD
jgi:hypothetical protein